ncbi:MAG: VOC family protein [Clostridia bacterium]|nr:VOC family protein [Clostridia bacterium]
MANEIIGGLGFHHIGLKVADLAKSRSMYAALGMKEVCSWGEGDSEIVMLDLGDGGRIELFAGGGDFLSKEGKWLHFAMKVDDVDAAYQTALAAGFAPKTAPKVVDLQSRPTKISINIAFVVGPDGEELEFFRQL